MGQSLLDKLLGRNGDDRVVSVDIGTSAIKLMELDLTGDKPKLTNAGVAPSPANSLKNNTIVKPEEVATVIRSVLEGNNFQATKAITAIPGPSVFTKKITLAQSSLKDLSNNISFEASNYIPHKIDAVHLDYQVLRANGTSTMDVLLVAVKNEIIGSFIDTLEQSGLEPVIADVDYFALENMFELNYPEEKERTVALINIGARYSGINIIQCGESIFTGDVAVGGRLYTDALVETLQIKSLEAEQAKMGHIPDGIDSDLVAETLERTTDHVASELHRQLGFFWNAAATDRSIEAVYVCGGGSQTAGLLNELSARTGMECRAVDAFRRIDCSNGFDTDYLKEIAPAMGVSIGLASRRMGDKVHAVS